MKKRCARRSTSAIRTLFPWAILRDCGNNRVAIPSSSDSAPSLPMALTPLGFTVRTLPFGPCPRASCTEIAINLLAVRGENLSLFAQFHSARPSPFFRLPRASEPRLGQNPPYFPITLPRIAPAGRSPQRRLSLARGLSPQTKYIPSGTVSGYVGPAPALSAGG